MVNNVPHDVVMLVMYHVVVMNITVVTLFGEGWTDKQRHRHGESGSNFLLHLRSPGPADKWRAGARVVATRPMNGM
jgi:hypothetical protein